MSFVSLGGDAGSRPTFFEVYAADKLVPSLRAAIVYSLSVRAPFATAAASCRPCMPSPCQLGTHKQGLLTGLL